MKERDIQIEDRVAGLRAQEATRAAPEPDINSDGWLNDGTAWLEQNTPILRHVLPDELKLLEPMAIREMAGEGTPFNRQSPRSVFDLRARVIEMGEHFYGHRMTPEDRAFIDRREGRGGSAPAGAAGQPAGARPARAGGVTTAQRAEKDALAARMPPDITKVGQAATADGVTDDQIVNMTDEQIEALPAEVRRRYMGQ
jgi:hypothetical protein